jgi:ribosome biogenesis GTPase A
MKMMQTENRKKVSAKSLRLSQADSEMLDNLARIGKTSKSSVIRNLIRKEAAKIDGVSQDGYTEDRRKITTSYRVYLLRQIMKQLPANGLPIAECLMKELMDDAK